MKRTEIQVGKTYTDGKGGERLVVALVDDTLGEFMYVQYKIFNRANGCTYKLGDVAGCTLNYFALWAKSEVKHGNI